MNIAPLVYVQASQHLNRVYIWYMGGVIAYLDQETGSLIWHSRYVPLYWIDYLLSLPRPERTRWN